MESIVDRGNYGSPHEYDDPEIIELIAECRHLFAMIGDGVVSGSQVNELQEHIVRRQGPTYTAERKKQMATPKKNTENTMTSTMLVDV